MSNTFPIRFESLSLTIDFLVIKPGSDFSKKNREMPMIISDRWKIIDEMLSLFGSSVVTSSILELVE